jgi:hypothetical protein
VTPDRSHAHIATVAIKSTEVVRRLDRIGFLDRSV